MGNTEVSHSKPLAHAGTGYVVKAKVGDLEKITRKGRTRRMSKEVVVFVQSVVGKNNFLVLFEDGQKK